MNARARPQPLDSWEAEAGEETKQILSTHFRSLPWHVQSAHCAEVLGEVGPFYSLTEKGHEVHFVST